MATSHNGRNSLQSINALNSGVHHDASRSDTSEGNELCIMASIKGWLALLLLLLRTLGLSTVDAAVLAVAAS